MDETNRFEGIVSSIRVPVHIRFDLAVNSKRSSNVGSGSSVFFNPALREQTRIATVS